MTETTTPTEPRSKVRVHPADLLMNLIVSLLAPMFLGVAGGDVYLARMAAAEAVNGYQTRNIVNLIAIAQIIACGLAALGSLSLSMTDDLTLPMTLRLRGNANALNRSAEQNRRAIRENHLADITPQPNAVTTETPTPIQDDFEAEVLVNLAKTHQLIADAQRNDATPTAMSTPIAAPTPVAMPKPATTPIPAAIPASIATPTPLAAPIPIAMPTPAAISAIAVAEPTDQQIQRMWASAMADVASEFTADLDKLPPAEREEASRQAALLSACANELILGSAPVRPRPGDLDAYRPRNTP